MLKDTLRAKEEDKQQLKLIKKKDTKELKLNTKQRRQITVKIKQDTEGWHGWNFKRN